MNLYFATVGQTAKARKGVAFGHAKELFNIAAPSWVRDCIETGLSSGEGLIHAISNRQSSSSHGKTMLVFEPELGSPLRTIQRFGNNLSPTLRQGWDGTSLGILTRKNPLKADGGHISIVGHITNPELRGLLSENDIFGGLANRFLWLCVRRHGIHHELGGLPNGLLEKFGLKIRSAIHAARKYGGELRFDDTAQRNWRRLYPLLSADHEGILGASISRAEAQVLRLSGCFSLLDKTSVVQAEHLEAAAAVWDYCLRSAAFIFSPRHRNTFSDRLLTLLQRSPNGMSRTQISAAFDNHKSGEFISQSLHQLSTEGRAKLVVVKTNGRSAEVWQPVSQDEAQS
jgi:hypothetical protein